MQAQMSAPAAPRQFEPAWDITDQAAVATLSQDAWIRRCAVRLHQLMPHGEPGLMMRVASDLWKQVSSFNPEIAAEIEHESGYWEH